MSHEMFLNAAKRQGYSFYRFWVIMGKPTGGAISPTHIKANFANEALNKLHFFGKFK